MKNILFGVVILFIIGCSSNKKKSDPEIVGAPKDSIELNSECDCKKYAIKHKIALPNLDDLYILSDSMVMDGGDPTEYQLIMKRVGEIRQKYDVEFINCYKKFGDLNVVDAACSVEEQRINAFNKALRLVKRNCKGSNQELMKYLAVKNEDKVIFMFMSVAQNGMICISGVSEINPNEILSADCGEADVKMAEWDALPEFKMKFQ